MSTASALPGALPLIHVDNTFGVAFIGWRFPDVILISKSDYFYQALLRPQRKSYSKSTVSFLRSSLSSQLIRPLVSSNCDLLEAKERQAVVPKPGACTSVSLGRYLLMSVPKRSSSYGCVTPST